METEQIEVASAAWSLFENARRTPDKVAIHSDYVSITYRRLALMVAGLAGRLRRGGWEAGQPIGMLGVNGHEPALAYFAAALLGAPCLLLPSDRAPAILGELIARIGPAAIVLGRQLSGEPCTAAMFAPSGTPISAPPLVIAADPPAGELGEYEDDWPDVRRTAAAAPHLILFTGGTTGLPKAVLYHEDRYLLATRAAVDNLSITAADVLVNPYPAHHFGGIQAISQTMFAGATLVQVPVPDEIAILRAIQRYRGTFIVAVPTLWRRMLQHPEQAGFDLSTLRMANVASDHIPIELMAAIRARTGARCIQGYGTTETGLVTLTPIEHESDKPGSCGIADRFSEVMVSAGGAKALPPRQVGRVLVRTAHGMQAYAGDPQATIACMEHGWYVSGDLGYLDEDGFLYITGREKNVISCGAEKLVPEEIEFGLRRFPGVQAAVVVGVADADLGEVPAALVVHDAETPFDAAALELYSVEQLGAVQRIRHAWAVPELPVTLAGKIDRQRAQALASEWAAPDAGAQAADAEDGAVFRRDLPRDPVEVQLQRIWQELLGRPSIGVHDDFFSLGGHSMLAARLAVRVREDFGVVITPSVLLRAPTIALLADCIPRVAEGVAASSLVALRTADGGKSPLHCVHGGSREVVAFRTLAAQLRTGRPVYGLRVPPSLDKHTLPRRIEDFAAMYVRAIRTVQPRGPYNVCGYHHGAVIAFEMAQQLREQGEDVGMLGMLDGSGPPGEATRADALHDAWIAVRTQPVGFVRYLLAREVPVRVRRLVDAGLRRFDRHGSRDDNWLGSSEERTDVSVALAEAYERYVPRSWPGRIHSFVNAQRALPAMDRWTRFADLGVVRFEFAGTVQTALQMPDGSKLARQLDDCLSATET
jgi:acyl-CoA synthetase (AMP-forming)/AMP-acid ligase II/thioesterase domain-containing protein